MWSGTLSLQMLPTCTANCAPHSPVSLAGNQIGKKCPGMQTHLVIDDQQHREKERAHRLLVHQPLIMWYKQSNCYTHKRSTPWVYCWAPLYAAIGGDAFQEPVAIPLAEHTHPSLPPWAIQAAGPPTTASRDACSLYTKKNKKYKAKQPPLLQIRREKQITLQFKRTHPLYSKLQSQPKN